MVVGGCSCWWCCCCCVGGLDLVVVVVLEGLYYDVFGFGDGCVWCGLEYYLV